MVCFYSFKSCNIRVEAFHSGDRFQKQLLPLKSIILLNTKRTLCFPPPPPDPLFGWLDPDQDKIETHQALQRTHKQSMDNPSFLGDGLPHAPHPNLQHLINWGDLLHNNDGDVCPKENRFQQHLVLVPCSFYLDAVCSCCSPQLSHNNLINKTILNQWEV